jgi:penicillin-binding protein 2
MRASELQRMISRRALLFGGVQAVAGVAILSRLYYLQFVHGAEFRDLAEGNRAKLQVIIPPRGRIVDRHGIELATNHVNYRLVLDADDRERARASLAQLTDLLQLTEREVKIIRQSITRRKVAVPVLVREHLSWEEVARVQYHMPELPLIRLEEGQWRHYPFADHASHLIGYVGKVSEKEVQEGQPLLKQPEMKIGKNGIEQLYEARLQGKAGGRQVEVNALGSPIRELSITPPTAGEVLPLTIDTRLQEFAISRLGEESGAVVVMDVHSGALHALVSMPAFDPNEFSKGIKHDYYEALKANKKAPLMNKAIAGQYPPGSTFKMITGLAGLRSGKFKPETRITCNGVFHLGNHPFGCWRREGHGTLDLAQAIAESCDVYFYTVAREIGIEALAEMSREFGLGQKSGLGLSGERPGIVPSPEWKRSVGRGGWNPGETINSAIGQGDSLTTPLQLAIMTARLVNDGQKILPRLLQDDSDKSEGTLDIDPEHLAVIREGMFRVTNQPRGTAYGSRIAEERYALGGKTGTSQVRRLLVPGQDQKTIPWEFRHHAWFVGYAPVHEPKLCCAVIIEHGGGGSSAAAPVARDVLLKAQELLDSLPPGSAAKGGA